MWKLIHWGNKLLEYLHNERSVMNYLNLLTNKLPNLDGLKPRDYKDKIWSLDNYHALFISGLGHMKLCESLRPVVFCCHNSTYKWGHKSKNYFFYYSSLEI